MSREIIVNMLTNWIPTSTYKGTHLLKNDSISGQGLALLKAAQELIPAPLMALRALPGVIPEHSRRES